MPDVFVPIVIVGFRNAGDIANCLSALAKAPPEPAFAPLICENGGPRAFDALVARLSDSSGPCPGVPADFAIGGGNFVRGCKLKLTDDITVTIGEARENLGYAGGVNAWLRQIQPEPGWSGVWVLNPDTLPSPEALAALVNYAFDHEKGMVGSRIMLSEDPTVVGSRGLAWNRWSARTIGVDKFAPVAPTPDPAEVERRIESPHGASFYVTRPCLERIGLMEEGYFLYFEDLEWGMRAKAACGLGYAFDSVVPHLGGTTIGSAHGRKDRSELSVYLDHRNRLLFVRRNFPGWYAWTVLMVLARTVEFLVVGAFGNFRAALAGWWAGLRGETGRPDRLLNR